MKNWQSRFAPHILERGMKYYYQGEVEELEKTEHGYKAVVYGTDVYDVDITIEGDEVTDMTCTCPHAWDGNNCKHMAAVLAAIEDLSSDQETGGFTYEERIRDESNVISFADEKAKMHEEFLDDCFCSESAEELVANADFDEIEAFLIMELESDERMRNRFKLFTTDIFTADEMQMYRSQLIDTFDSFKDEHGFVAYYMADELEDALYEFIDTVICRLLLDNAKAEEAFLLTAAMIEQLDRLDIDDSNGIIVNIISTCRTIISDIIESSNDFLESQIFRWIEKRLESDGNDFVRESVMALWCENFHKPLYLTQKKELIISKLHACEDIEDEYSRKYRIGEWISAYLDIAGRMSIPEEEIDTFEKKYWEFSDVRQHAVNRHVADGEISTAIDILKGSMEKDRHMRGLIRSYGQQLAALYKTAGDKAALRRLLTDFVTEYIPGDPEFFRALKKECSKNEWPEVRSSVLGKLPESHVKAELYREEKMYDKLMDYVMISKAMGDLKTYEKDLRARYPQKLLIVYEHVVREEAKHAGDRRHYKEIVKILRRMKRYPDGAECVQRIAAEFRETYKRRTAMMEELSRL